MRKSGKINILMAFLFVFCPAVIFGQSDFPLNHDMTVLADTYLNASSQTVFSAMKPYRQQTVEKICNIDSAWAPGTHALKKNRWIWRKLFKESLFQVHKKDFSIDVDPLFDLQLTGDLFEKKLLYNNSRGIRIQGQFFNKLFFSTSFVESQALFPAYINKFIQKYEVVPGQGKVKKFKSNAYDFGVPQAYVTYQPIQDLSVQLGNAKQFIGDGYRSLLLSDNSFPFTSLKVSYHHKWFYYQNIFATLQNLSSDSVFNTGQAWYHGNQTKQASFHFMGFNIGKKVDLGLFEACIFEPEKNGNAFNFESLNPIIFVNTLRFSLKGKNNTLLGLTIKYSPNKHFKLYGQCMIDNLDNKKPFSSSSNNNNWGFQLGGTYFSVCGINNLNWQIEYNQVQPFSYAHTNPLVSYTHYNQPLAHPLGANFAEVISCINYRYKRLFSEFQFNFARTGNDYFGSNFGQWVFDAKDWTSCTASKLLQGEKTTIVTSGIRLSYVLNPKSNLQIECGYYYRAKSNSLGRENTGLIFFGLKTALQNFYFDF